MSGSPYIVESDGKTVWVNNEACCLGRFSRFGIDVHRDLREQIAGASECLDCTHERPSPEDWDRFVDGMARYHAVRVPGRYRPRWLDAEPPTSPPLGSSCVQER